MGEVLQTNVFFFITGVAVVAVTAFLVWALYHFVRVLRSVRAISEIIEEELYILREDVAEARSFIRSEGVKFRHVLGFISALFMLGEKMKGRVRTSTKRSRRTTKEEHHEEQ